VYTLYQECRKRITTCSCEQVSGTVSGRVYYDEGNTCSTATPWSTGGLSARLRGTGYTASVGSDGRFSITAPQGAYSYLDLEGVAVIQLI
jgi:hypothetical protein